MQARRCCGTGCAASRGWAPERRPLARQRHRLRVMAKADDAASGANGKQSSSSSSGGTPRVTGSSGCSGNGTLTAQRPQSIDLGAKQSVDLADCSASCATQQRVRQRTAVQWPQKSELYLLRSDGHSCTRETVQPSGNLQFECPSSQQQLLVWKTRPRQVMVLKKLGSELLEEFLEVLRYCGERLGMRVVVEPHDYQLLEPLGLAYVDTYEQQDLADLHSFVDFVVCLGGDGLLLHAASLFGPGLPPVISFKLGSLGFLTTHSFSDYRRHLHNVVHGCRELESCQLISAEDGRSLLGVHITLRMRLQCEVWRDGQMEPEETFEVLNEVVLSRGANPYLSKIEVYERDQLITKVQADGVMIATPTGSTAYNVAAGGSMVHPSVPAILFTPICPHSLNFRPVILPDYVELEMRIAPGARCSAVANFDGRDTRELHEGDSIRVRMSPNPVPTINNADMTTDWFTSIQRCFQWSERIEQLPMEPAGEPRGAAERRGSSDVMLTAEAAESTLTNVGSLLDSVDFSDLIPPALLARLSITLLLVWLARLGHFIPLPGIAWAQATGNSAVQMLMGRTEVIANVFVLSIAPLMSANFLLSVMQIVPFVRQHFAALREEGTRGQEVYTTYITACFFVFALWEAFTLARQWAPHLATQAAAGASAATSGGGGTGFILWAVLILTAGAVICKTICQSVEQRGLGDGASLLIASGVAINYANFLGDAARQLALSPPALPALLLVAGMCTALSAATLWMQSVQLWVPLAFYRTESSMAASTDHPLQQLLAQPPKQGWREPNLRPGPKAPILEVEGEDKGSSTGSSSSGSSSSGSGRGSSGSFGSGASGHRFPLRLSPAGARSLLFANFWTALLATPLSWLGLGNPFESALGFALLVFLVEGITVADVTPRQMSQYLQASDAGIPNLSPGEPTLRYFAEKRQQLKILNAALLAALSLAARAVDAVSTALIGVPAGCLSILLLVSTAALGTRQVEALTRAPVIDELAARQQAPALAGGTRTAFPGPEAWW
ncbi:ATP-NAD kinase isoform B [Chlorella sorokiniana]|uniref:ATP-NAD kinase isoform B n=1 Tax=Chlorella sorokiniana TaxID=3076 RepID=A0A2P6TV50_CHLSO|nr:ATP-NAD kinase isoform B [Chlorella sorokiniana]|eukprot:PRW57924.1 ATP-NAD kinase isoform B [Chlorella sorokiniana]